MVTCYVSLALTHIDVNKFLGVAVSLEFLTTNGASNELEG